MGDNLDSEKYLEILNSVEPGDKFIFEYDIEEFKDYRRAIEQMRDENYCFYDFSNK